MRIGKNSFIDHLKEWFVPAETSDSTKNRRADKKSPQTKKPRQLLGSDKSETLIGSRRDEIIDGKGGDDYLNGRAGNDIYLFGRASGNDTIAEHGMGDLGYDCVLFDSAIRPADVVIQREGRDDVLLLILPASGNVLRIEGYFFLDGKGPAMIEQLKFADGTVWDFDYVFAATLQGTAGNDMITGSSRDDVLDGGAGNDVLDGRGGSDTYLFGRDSGNDTICEWAHEDKNDDAVLFNMGLKPTDLVLSRTRNDALVITIVDTQNTLTIEDYFYRDGHHGGMIEYLKFADGTIWTFDHVLAQILEGTTGNDIIIGSRRNDTLHGQSGHDYLDGRNGNDTYLFGRSSGHNMIAEHSNEIANEDRVLFDPDLSGHQIEVRRLGRSDTLMLTIAETESRLQIENYFYRDGINTSMIEYLVFADGTVWDFKTILAKTLAGTIASDTLIGSNGDDILNGLAGNDFLDGRNGADTYLFGKGYGHDTIDEWADDGAIDRVCFADDLSVEDIDIYRDGHSDTLVLTIRETNDSLRLMNYFACDGRSPAMIEELKFANGMVLDFDAVLAKTLRGSERAETLIGSGRADVIDGQAGNDYLDGRGGSDTYLFGRQSDNDTIYESLFYSANRYEIDRVIFDRDIVIDDLDLQRESNDDLLITIVDSRNTLRIARYFENEGKSASLIEQLQFNNGMVLDFNAVLGMVNNSRLAKGRDMQEQAVLLSTALASMPVIEVGGASLFPHGYQLVPAISLVYGMDGGG